MIMDATAARRGKTRLPGRLREVLTVLSLHTGYDTGYLTDAVGTGADYYLGAKGEPPATGRARGPGPSA